MKIGTMKNRVQELQAKVKAHIKETIKDLKQNPNAFAIEEMKKWEELNSRIEDKEKNSKS